MVGNWDVNVNIGGMPQKLATAFGELTGNIIGAQYTPIAYIGSQVVNGINHAILAEQLLITGKDTKNIVLMIFNEKPDGITLVNIERIVESGAEFGGTVVDVKTDIPDEAKAIFNEALTGFVGSAVEPFALLATQVVKGVDYIFAATVKPVVPDPKSTAAIVVVNGLDKKITFIDMLQSNLNKTSLGYAFTW